MGWTNEKLRAYRRYGDGRDSKKAYDKEYGKKNRERIRAAAIARPIAPDAPDKFTCKRCDETKPFTPEFFTYRPHMRFKLTYVCRACQNKGSLEHQAKKKYGLTIAQVRELRTNPCEICGDSSKSVIDHCHTSGKVRGVLCSKCNVGLGQFDDSLDKLAAAIKYMERFT